MKLFKLKMKNFRCYQEETEIIFDDLTALIGKNDIGKSTVFEALDAFFNDKIDAGDLTINASANTIEISCIFNHIQDSIVLDTSIETSPLEECILNNENMLEIKKTFTFGSKVTKATYLLAYHPNDIRIKDILSLKNSPLKDKARELGIDLTGVDSRKNPPLRKKIREFINSDKELISLKVDGSLDSSDNLKDIWSSLKKLLPVYSLFKVDKELGDKDKDVQDPMDTAIKEALALPEIMELLTIIEEKVREYSTATAEKTIEKLKEFDESLAENLKSEFSKEPTYNKIFDLKLLNENNIPLNKRGSGIRRLVLLSFFQARAERKKIDDKAPAIIYAIEEPETSQHPNHQLLLMDALTRLSRQDDIQVIFTTHSANLVKEIPIDSLRYIFKTDDGIKIDYGKSFTTHSNNEDVINNIIKTLGILPNPLDSIKVLVYVEGNNDVFALKKYSEILNANDNNILNLNSSASVGFVIAGGGSLKHYINNKYLSGLGKPEVHIYDNDVAEYRTVVNRINGENNPRKKAFNTSKRELENYLHKEAIIEAYCECGTNNLTLPEIDDTMDVPFIVAEATCLAFGNDWTIVTDDIRKEKANDKKKFLNTKALDKMTIDRINERKGYSDLKEWLDTIKQFME